MPGVPRPRRRRPLPPPDDGPEPGQDALQILQIGVHPLRIDLRRRRRGCARPWATVRSRRSACCTSGRCCSSWQAGQYHQCGEPLFRHSVVGRKRRRHRRQGHSMRPLLRRSLRDRRLRRAAVRAGPRRRRTAIPTRTRCTFWARVLRSRVSGRASCADRRDDIAPAIDIVTVQNETRVPPECWRPDVTGE